VNARLSRTASAASGTLRPRAAARDRAYAAASEAAFFAVVSSIASPDPDTGVAAPMWVPGAMTATSAASARMKPADAARAPDGPTNTTTGARDASMRDTMARVESSSPPGVRRMMITTAAPDVSASFTASVRYSADTGWMMPSNSATTAMGREGGCACAKGDAAPSTRSAAVASAVRIMIGFYLGSDPGDRVCRGQTPVTDRLKVE
jgi:hypothetical protein